MLLIFGPLIDRILGLRKLENFYNHNNLKGLQKEDFVREVQLGLNVNFEIHNDAFGAIQSKGALIIVCNHPYGGVEGIILADILSKVRKDVKFMANSGLRLIREMKDFFLFTNPLITHNYKNISSIRACRDHLEKGGILVLFPAGKVSFYRKEQKRITDGDWNRIAARLSLNLNTPVLPIFIAGQNSKLFYAMGRAYYRLRLFMLPREFLKMKNKTVEIYCGSVLQRSHLRGSSREITDFLRMQAYLRDPDYVIKNEHAAKTAELPNLIPAVPFSLIRNELTKLPDKQQLFHFGDFSVYYGYYSQLRNTIREIARLRELTFRELQEGSGTDKDTDRFDYTYTQLFVVNNRREEIIGAYRMGQVNRLLEEGDIDDLYLSKMFNFEGDFYSKIQSGVEMGRSFLIKREQKSTHGFFLLWRGIGEFMVRNPEYRYLYGTVSLSNLYDPRSIALIHRVLVGKRNSVDPLAGFTVLIHPEVEEYVQKYKPDLRELDRLIKTIESDGKGLPVLVRQYAKLGAQFVSIANDIEFRGIFGLLLIVNTGEASVNSIKRYFGDGTESYLNYKEPT